MVGANFPEAAAGLLLVFFLPGYALTKATFPEWRIRGPTALLRLVEVVTLGFVSSVVLTVLVGYFLLVGAPGGFQAYWTDPILELLLASLAAIAFAVGWLRGAYRRDGPLPAPREAGPGEEAAWELSRELEQIGREERRIAHALRSTPSGSSEGTRLREELERLRTQRERLRQRREDEYAA
ncbi:MAG: DUF1616 domain-containing protein [Thermoplasmata archaeon]